MSRRESVVSGIVGPMTTLSQEQTEFLTSEVARLGLEEVLKVKQETDYFLSKGHVIGDWKGDVHTANAGNFAFAEKVALLFGSPEVSNTPFGGYFDVINITAPSQKGMRVQVVGNEVYCLKNLPVLEIGGAFHLDISDRDQENFGELVVPQRIS